MSGFLYFLSGWSNPVTADVVHRTGLRYAFDSPPMFAQLTGRTPSGSPGSLVADRTRVDDLAYRPESQRWEKMPGDGTPEIWVGLRTDSPPTPADLVRPGALSGPLVRLADGNAWQAPLLLCYATENGFELNLPSYVDTGPDGRLVMGETVEEYRPAADLAERVFEIVKSGASAEDRLRVSVEVLAINYALSTFEATKFLRLFRTDVDYSLVLKAAADWSKFTDAMEKKTTGGS